MECLVSEDNMELLNAMEKLEVKILKFEHMLEILLHVNAIFLVMIIFSTCLDKLLMCHFSIYCLRTRRRMLRQKRVVVHKVEKLLDVFPQAIFTAGMKSPLFMLKSQSFYHLLCSINLQLS